MSTVVLNLKYDSTASPSIKMFLEIIKHAVLENADAIVLELDTELHLKVQEELAMLVEARDQKLLTPDQYFFKLSRLPTAFSITYLIAGKPEPNPSANGEFFGDFIRFILVETGIPPWTKGQVSTSFETIKPVSKWTFESKDLTRLVELKRIRAI
jgi:hypothetical protein